MSNKVGMDYLRSRMAVMDYRSLQEVAEAVGINRGNLYRYFTLENKPSVALLPKLCVALDSDMRDMLVALGVTVPKGLA